MNSTLCKIIYFSNIYIDAIFFYIKRYMYFFYTFHYLFNNILNVTHTNMIQHSSTCKTTFEI